MWPSGPKRTTLVGSFSRTSASTPTLYRTRVLTQMTLRRQSPRRMQLMRIWMGLLTSSSRSRTTALAPNSIRSVATLRIHWGINKASDLTILRRRVSSRRSRRKRRFMWVTMIWTQALGKCSQSKSSSQSTSKSQNSSSFSTFFHFFMKRSVSVFLFNNFNLNL